VSWFVRSSSGLFASFESLNITDAVITRRRCGPDCAELTQCGVRGVTDPIEIAFEEGEEIDIIGPDFGTCFSGVIEKPTFAQCDARFLIKNQHQNRLESQIYLQDRPFFDANNLPDVLPDPAMLPLQPTSSVILGMDVDGQAMSVFDILNDIALQGGGLNGPWQIDIDPALMECFCPWDEVADVTLWEVLKRTARWVPGVQIWWDYRLLAPTLFVRFKDNMPQVDIDLADERIKSFTNCQRTDLAREGVIVRQLCDKLHIFNQGTADDAEGGRAVYRRAFGSALRDGSG